MTTYYLEIPVAITVSHVIEAEDGLTQKEINNLINWENLREIDYDPKAIRCAALEASGENKAYVTDSHEA